MVGAVLRGRDCAIFVLILKRLVCRFFVPTILSEQASHIKAQVPTARSLPRSQRIARRYPASERVRRFAPKHRRVVCGNASTLAVGLTSPRWCGGSR